MKGGTRPLGYTIIEVMIVLAVSGLMFVIAAGFISGKQARTAFTEGTNEFNSQVQTIITQVINGQFTDVNFGCQLSGTTFTITATPPPVSNPQCVFLGKLLQFSYGGVSTKYAVYSLLADRQATDITPVTAITPAIANGSPSPFDLTAYQTVPQNLDASLKVYDTSGSLVSATAVGFMQSLGSNAVSGFSTGSQTVSLYYTASTPLGAGNNVSLKPAGSAVICVSDGTRFAQIKLGDNANSANQLSAFLKVVAIC